MVVLNHTDANSYCLLWFWLVLDIIMAAWQEHHVSRNSRIYSVTNVTALQMSCLCPVVQVYNWGWELFLIHHISISRSNLYTSKSCIQRRIFHEMHPISSLMHSSASFSLASSTGKRLLMQRQFLQQEQQKW
jgi:hypothetical protein